VADKKQKIGFGRALSRAGTLPPISPVAVLAGLGIGSLFVAFFFLRR
jgi:hypothetical protein